MAIATFGAGCFWGTEELFRKLNGVTDTAVGYMGGNVPNPTYEQVCTDKTGHAEVVYVEYDPTAVTYEELLQIFWLNHNPTTLNRQGEDVGTQYRSVVFYQSEEQRKAAELYKEKLQQSGKFQKPVVTEIVEASTFWRAEDYHQRYLQKKGVSSCSI